MIHEDWRISEARIKFGDSSWEGNKMTILKFNPDGGDLGIGIKISLIELTIITPHITEILEYLAVTNNQHEKFKYGFSVTNTNSNLLYDVINHLEKSFPAHVRWYDVDGRKAFELRGSSGGIVTALACYLVTK